MNPTRLGDLERRIHEDAAARMDPEAGRAFLEAFEARARPVVVVVRDPDFSNVVSLHGVEALVVDVDLGYNDLGDPTEFAEWAESMWWAVEGLRDNHPARAQVVEVVEGIRERFGHPGNRSESQ